jgi:hypothetical protein
MCPVPCLAGHEPHFTLYRKALRDRSLAAESGFGLDAKTGGLQEIGQWVDRRGSIDVGEWASIFGLR